MLAAKKEDYGERLDRVLAHYKEDLNESSLRAQMTMFQKMFPDNDTLCYTDVIDFFKKLEPGKRKLLSEVCKVFELILVCLLYTSPSPRDKRQSRMPSSA